MASSRFRNPSAMRSIVDDLNRSVLYSSATQSRSPSLAVIIVRSNSAVCFSSAIDSASSPCRFNRAPGMPSANGARPWLVETLGFLVGEHHLEQGRPAGIGISLEPIDEQTEGKVLMFQARGDGPAHAAQEFVETAGSPRGRPASAPG